MELKGWIKAEWGVSESEVSSYTRLNEAIAKALQTA
jgi:hypothetical protein